MVKKTEKNKFHFFFTLYPSRKSKYSSCDNEHKIKTNGRLCLQI